MQVGFDERQAELIATADNDVDALFPPLSRAKSLMGWLKLVYQWPIRLYNSSRHLNTYEACPWFGRLRGLNDSRLAWSRRYFTLAANEFSDSSQNACIYLGYALHSRQDLFFHPRLFGHQPWWDDEHDPRRTPAWRETRQDTLTFLKDWRKHANLPISADWDSPKGRML